jgi:hypothetical protein
MRTVIVLAASVVCFAANGLAQGSAAIDKVQAAPQFQATATEQFHAYEAKLTTACTSVSLAWPRAAYKVYGQPQVAGDGNLVNATWVEMVPGTACGQARRYRVLVMIRGGKATIAPILPGESIASPRLETDAQGPMIAATAAFVPKGASCPVDVLDTKLVGAAPAAGTKDPWNEMWLVQTCGKRLNVPIQFVPDAVGVGTSIKIESKAVMIAP